MSLHTTVHCHVCGLKECCSYSEQDASYRWHNRGRWKRDNERVVPQADDFAKVQKATMNCPLKAMLQEWQMQKLKQVFAR